MGYAKMPRQEAVNHMQDMVRKCDGCEIEENELCGYHQAEIRELQYEFTADINKEILSFSKQNTETRESS